MQHRFILTLFIAGLVCLASFTTVPAQDEVMTNDEVISLSKAGLSPTIILGKIRSGKSNFDVSTDSLIKLKQAGVSDDIIAAMIAAKSAGSTTGSTATTMTSGDDPNNPLSKHSYGIYLYEVRGEQRKMTQLAPNVSAQNRTGGTFTSSLTYGIGKV